MCFSLAPLLRLGFKYTVSPVFISSYEKESMNEILNYPDPKILSIGQNINLNNISNFWIGKYLENKQIILLSIYNVMILKA